MTINPRAALRNCHARAMRHNAIGKAGPTATREIVKPKPDAWRVAKRKRLQSLLKGKR